MGKHGRSRLADLDLGSVQEEKQRQGYWKRNELAMAWSSMQSYQSSQGALEGHVWEEKDRGAPIP